MFHDIIYKYFLIIGGKAMFETKIDYDFAETIINCMPELTRKKEQEFISVTNANECLSKMEEMKKQGYTYVSFIPFGERRSTKILVFEKPKSHRM